MATPESSQFYDVIVLGAGAAGLMCGFTAAQRGRSVLVLEISNKVGKKILMSGGGRCNFTNLEVSHENFICPNPHFVKSALKQYTQWDFIDLVAKHGIAYHEKTLGQLFCDNSSKDVVNLLINECQLAGVGIQVNCEVRSVDCTDNSSGAQARYRLMSSLGQFTAQSVVIATGGLSIPSLGGASGFGYKLAKQYGLSVSPTEASLVPLTLTGQWHEFAQNLSGVSIPVCASVPAAGFNENMLFTHRGLSGPAILQLSNYWHAGCKIELNLMPDFSVFEMLLEKKQKDGNTTITATLSRLLPKSLAQALQTRLWPEYAHTSIQEIKNTELQRIAHQLNHWQLTPSGTEGYRTAEVTRGGVNVDQISSKTMQVVHQPGLFFIGEVLDVVGHLGGFNFQWAWSSGYVAGCHA